MLKKILGSIKESFQGGFKWGFNLARYGKLEAPEPEFVIDEDHKYIAEDIFNTSCVALNDFGEAFPMFFLLKENRCMPIVIDPITSGSLTTEDYISKVTGLAHKHNVDAILFISEQWKIKRELSEEEIELYTSGKLLPSLDPNSQEVLSLIYFSADGKIESLVGEIQRDVNNAPFVRESKWCKEDLPAHFQGWR
jgi:hypothetical protein